MVKQLVRVHSACTTWYCPLQEDGYIKSIAVVYHCASSLQQRCWHASRYSAEWHEKQPVKSSPSVTVIVRVCTELANSGCITQ